MSSETERSTVEAAAAAIAVYVTEQRQEARREARWKKLKRTFWAVIVAGGVLVYMAGMALIWTGGGDGSGWWRMSRGDAVAVIPITGVMRAGAPGSADTIVPLIEEACKDDTIKALALTIDSPGGSPVEAARIGAAIERCREVTSKPIHAVIGAIGASAAYMVAMKADEVSASRYSLVGSIGAIMRSMNLSDAGEQWGIAENTVRSGPYKGGASIWERASPEITAVDEELVHMIGKEFQLEVVTARGGRLHADAQTLLSGRLWTAKDALALGLIDRIAVLEELQDDTFKGLTVRKYHARASFAKIFGMEDVARAAAAELVTPRVE